VHRPLFALADIRDAAHAIPGAVSALHGGQPPAIANTPLSAPTDHVYQPPRTGWRTKAEHTDLAGLSIWAVDARYPSDNPDAVQSDAQSAVAEAQAIWEAIHTELTARGLDPAA
jgi:hypothetical protein